jgi:hypothetical protein
VTRHTLTGADLFIILKTLQESATIANYFSTKVEAREATGDKIARMLCDMTVTIDVNNDEDDR